MEKAYLVVKIVCDQAVVDGYLARTRCVGIHLPRDESKPMRIVTPINYGTSQGASTVAIGGVAVAPSDYVKAKSSD